MRCLSEGIGVAGIGGAEGSGEEEDFDLGEAGAELFDDFAGVVDSFLADAADEDEVGLAREDVFLDAVLLFEVSAVATAANVNGGLDEGLWIGFGEFGDPAGAHGIVDDAVAKGEDAKLSSFG